MTPSTRRNPFARSLAAGLAALSLVAATACSGAEEETQERDFAYEGTHDAQLASRLGEYQGEDVRITGEVTQLLSMYAFTVGDSQEGEVLVVAQDGAPDVKEGGTVEVTGTVHRGFDELREKEQELGHDYGEAALIDWRDEPYVLAETVAVSEGE